MRTPRALVIALQRHSHGLHEKLSRLERTLANRPVAAMEVRRIRAALTEAFADMSGELAELVARAHKHRVTRIPLTRPTVEEHALPSAAAAKVMEQEGMGDEAP